MRHVKDIKALVEAGRLDEAFEAIENLLTLGPKNTEALKIKASLLAACGKQLEEQQVWKKILELDNEDEEAIVYFRKLYMEERESFYFTDELPSGGRRFLAYPRSIINASFMGLIGCALFLLFSNLTKIFPFFTLPYVSLLVFTVFVLFPWIFIVLSYLRSLREVLVTREGLKFSTFFKSHTILWKDVACFYLTYQHLANNAPTLLFQPKDTHAQYIEVDISDHTSSIRAPHFFMVEVIRWYGGEPRYLKRDELKVSPKYLLTF